MLCLIGSIALLGCSDNAGARLYPVRVAGAVCDAQTGKPIGGATVVLTQWIGTAFDESPSTRVGRTAPDGALVMITGVARRVEVEIGAPGYHPMGWLFSKQDRFCLEPVSPRAVAEIKTFRVGYREGVPFGFRFDSGAEETTPSAWDIGPVSARFDRSRTEEVIVAFRGNGGAVAIDDKSKGVRTEYFFSRNFLAPSSGYESRIRLTLGRSKEGTCWFFRDSAGSRYGKARLTSFYSGVNPSRDWHAEYSYVYGSDGERHLEPRWRELVPRWPVK